MRDKSSRELFAMSSVQALRAYFEFKSTVLEYNFYLSVPS